MQPDLAARVLARLRTTQPLAGLSDEMAALCAELDERDSEDREHAMTLIDGPILHGPGEIIAQNVHAARSDITHLPTRYADGATDGITAKPRR